MQNYAANSMTVDSSDAAGGSAVSTSREFQYFVDASFYRLEGIFAKALSGWNCPQLLVCEGEAMALVNADRFKRLDCQVSLFYLTLKFCLTVSKVEVKVHRSLTLLFLVLEVY